MIAAKEEINLGGLFKSFREVRNYSKNMTKRTEIIPFSAAAKLVEQLWNINKWLLNSYYCNAI